MLNPWVLFLTHDCRSLEAKICICYSLKGLSWGFAHMCLINISKWQDNKSIWPFQTKNRSLQRNGWKQPGELVSHTSVKPSQKNNFRGEDRETSYWPSPCSDGGMLGRGCTHPGLQTAQGSEPGPGTSLSVGSLSSWWEEARSSRPAVRLMKTLKKREAGLRLCWSVLCQQSLTVVLRSSLSISLSPALALATSPSCRVSSTRPWLSEDLSYVSRR